MRTAPPATVLPPLPAAGPVAGPVAAPGLPRASGARGVLELTGLAQTLRQLQPPVAYRLSLDSGVEYRNVRHALQCPTAARVDTWLRLLGSLRIRMCAARCAEDLIWPHSGNPVTVVGPGGLGAVRLRRGWSRRTLAQQAGVSVDAVISAEDGRGLVSTLLQVCEALGLQLLLCLPPGHASVESVWQEQAHRCLEEPAQYPAARRRPRGTGR